MAYPGFYVGAVTVTPSNIPDDQDATAGEAGSVAALDLNGYRGAIITVHHSPRGGASASFCRFRQGDTADWTLHEDIGDSLYGFIRKGVTESGFPRALSVLIDTSRFKRYISVTHATGANQYVGVVGMPILPIQASKDQLDRTTANKNLFITSAGELTFPATTAGA